MRGLQVMRKELKRQQPMPEDISSLMDGEWDEAGLDAGLDDLLAALGTENDAGQLWQEYHLIGDIIAGRIVIPPLPQGAAEPVSADFMGANFIDKFSARLAAEPVVLAPRRAARSVHMGRKRWVALSMAASIAVVSTSAWVVSRGLGPTLAPERMTVATPSVPTSRVPAQDTYATNPYLVAHQTMAGNPGFNAHPVMLSGADLPTSLGVPTH